MGILDFLKPKPVTEENRKKQILLQGCTIADLSKIAKAYISEDPKMPYKDENGLTKYRKPSRPELVSNIVKQVSLEGICDTLPKLKTKLAEIERTTI